MGQIAAALGTLVGLRLLTEVVPPDVYGNVTLTVGLTTLGLSFAAYPLMQAALRLYPDYAATGDVGSLREIAVRALRLPLSFVLVSLVVILTAWWCFGSNQPLAVGALIAVLAAALLIIDVARSVEINFLNAARRQRAMALLVLADAWVRPLGAVAAVLIFGANLAAVLFGYVVGCAIALGAFYWCTGGFRVAERDEASTEIDEGSAQAALVRYARPLILLPVVGWVTGQADRYLLAAFAGMQSAGIYAALYGLASRPFMMLAMAVELALRQPYYECVSAGDWRGERRIFWAWLGCAFAASAALLLLFVFCHRPLATLLLAAEYRTESALLCWIAAGYVLAVCSYVVERVCYAWHDTRGVLVIEVTAAVGSIVATVPMIIAFGLRGAAWCVPVYFGLRLIVAVVLARRAREAARVGGYAHVAEPKRGIANVYDDQSEQQLP